MPTTDNVQDLVTHTLTRFGLNDCPVGNCFGIVSATEEIILSEGHSSFLELIELMATNTPDALYQVAQTAKRKVNSREALSRKEQQVLKLENVLEKISIHQSYQNLNAQERASYFFRSSDSSSLKKTKPLTLGCTKEELIQVLTLTSQHFQNDPNRAVFRIGDAEHVISLTLISPNKWLVLDSNYPANTYLKPSGYGTEQAANLMMSSLQSEQDKPIAFSMCLISEAENYQRVKLNLFNPFRADPLLKQLIKHPSDRIIAWGLSSGAVAGVAAKVGDNKVLKLWLKLGLQPDAFYIDQGDSLVHLAVCSENPKAVQTLIKARANLNFPDVDGNSPLHLAAQLWHDNDKIVKELIKAGAHPNSVNAKGETPLHLAIAARNLNIIGTLAKKTDLNIRELTDLNTALHLATSSGDLEIVKILVKAGAQLHIRNRDGLTAMQLAERDNLSNIAEFLSSKASSAPIAICKTRTKRSLASGICRLSPKKIELLEEQEALSHYQPIKKLLESHQNPWRSEVNEQETFHPTQLKTPFHQLASRLNEAFQIYQLATAALSENKEAIAWSVGSIGLSVIDDQVTKNLGRLRASRIVPLRWLGNFAPVVGKSIGMAPVAFALIQDIKHFQETRDPSAIVDITVDTSLTVIGGVEAGMLVLGLEMGPEGTLASIFILLASNIYHTNQILEQIEKIVPLYAKQEFIEGLRLFFGMEVSESLKVLEHRAENNWELLKRHIQQFYSNNSANPFQIGLSTVSLGSLKETSVTSYASGVKITGSFNPCLTCDATMYRRACDTKINTTHSLLESDDVVRTVQKCLPKQTIPQTLVYPFQRLKEEFPALRIFCLPVSEASLRRTSRMVIGKQNNFFTRKAARCPYENVIRETKENLLSPRPHLSLPTDNNGTLLCHNTLVISRSQITESDRVLVSLGEANDIYETQLDNQHIFLVRNGQKRFTGSRTQSDVVIFMNNACPTGQIDLQNGSNILDFSKYCTSQNEVFFNFSRTISPNETLLTVKPSNPSSLLVKGAMYVQTRSGKPDHIEISGSCYQIDGQGGNDQIRITNHARVQFVFLHAGDHATLIGEHQPIQWIVRPTNHRNNAPIQINARAITGVKDAGTHLAFLNANLTEITEICFHTGIKQRLDLKFKNQTLRIVYPEIGNRLKLFAWVTKEKYTLFFTLPLSSLQGRTSELEVLRTGILYTTQQPGLENFSSFVAKIRSINHPTIHFTKYGYMGNHAVIVGGLHSQVFDIIHHPTQPIKHKYFIAGSDTNTYVIRLGNHVTIDASTPTIDQTVRRELIDLRKIHMNHQSRLELTRSGRNLQVDIIQSPEAARTVIHIKNYEALQKRHFLILEDEQAQYYSLPDNLMQLRLQFEYNAHLLDISNQEGITSLPADQIVQLKYSQIKIEALLSTSVEYYRQQDHLLIVGHNAEGNVLGLFIIEFYSKFLERLCGRRPCQLGLTLQEETFEWTTIPWETLKEHAQEAEPYKTYLNQIHEQAVDSYVFDYHARNVTIDLDPKKINLINFEQVLTGHLKVQVAKIRTYEVALTIKDEMINKTTWLELHIPTPPEQQNLTMSFSETWLGFNRQHWLSLGELCRRQSNHRARINQDLATTLNQALGTRTKREARPHREFEFREPEFSRSSADRPELFFYTMIKKLFKLIVDKNLENKKSHSKPSTLFNDHNHLGFLERKQEQAGLQTTPKSIIQLASGDIVVMPPQQALINASQPSYLHKRLIKLNQENTLLAGPSQEEIIIDQNTVSAVIHEFQPEDKLYFLQAQASGRETIACKNRIWTDPYTNQSLSYSSHWGIQGQEANVELTQRFCSDIEHYQIFLGEEARTVLTESWQNMQRLDSTWLEGISQPFLSGIYQECIFKSLKTLAAYLPSSLGKFLEYTVYSVLYGLMLYSINELSLVTICEIGLGSTQVLTALSELFQQSHAMQSHLNKLHNLLFYTVFTLYILDNPVSTVSYLAGRKVTQAVATTPSLTTFFKPPKTRQDGGHATYAFTPCNRAVLPSIQPDPTQVAPAIALAERQIKR